ncbi:hypothetical protein [Oceanicaulis alexandrii]|uniref:hypothetical protein n=1 Tax=Oceanicaulis alexandrii TaxID=153233 RepID=UPI0023573F27|nr:hypothetical protein [Oceanicaulis alexandrii]
MIRILFSLAAGACLAGCSSFSDAVDGMPQWRPLTLSAETARSLQINHTGDEPLEASAVLAARASAPRNDRLDRATAMLLISESDRQCDEYFASITTTANTTRASLSLVALGTSTAAGLSAPQRSANLLAGISTFFTGAQSTLEDTILESQSTRTLQSAVRSRRTEMRTELSQRILASDGEGALTLISGHIQDYHARCGLAYGLDAVSEVVTESVNTAEDRGREAADVAEENVRNLRDEASR